MVPAKWRTNLELILYSMTTTISARSANAESDKKQTVNRVGHFNISVNVPHSVRTHVMGGPTPKLTYTCLPHTSTSTYPSSRRATLTRFSWISCLSDISSCTRYSIEATHTRNTLQNVKCSINSVTKVQAHSWQVNPTFWHFWLPQCNSLRNPPTVH